MLPGAAPLASAETNAVSESYIDNSGIIHYAYDATDRPGARFVDDVGDKLPGGCGFSASGTGLGQTRTVTVVDEVSYDPSSCTRTLSVATYPVEEIPQGLREDLEGATALDGEPSALASSWAVSLITWIEDPVKLTTTKTSTRRYWNSTGGYSGSHYRYQATNTGWTLTGYSPIDTASYSDTIARFQNTAFCNPSVATYANHNATRITTQTNGSWTYSQNMYKWGDCSSLLSYHYSTYS